MENETGTKDKSGGLGIRLKSYLSSIWNWIKNEFKVSPIKTIVACITFLSLLTTGVLTAIFTNRMVVLVLIISFFTLVFVLHLRKNRSDQKYPKNWAGITLSFSLIFLIAVLFFPTSGDWIESKYFPEPSSSLVVLLTPTQITSLTPTPTASLSPTPTSTSTRTIVPTLTPTITPTFPSEEFDNSRIKDDWKLYPSYLMQFLEITPGPYPTYQPVGISGLDPGLQIVTRPTSKDQMTSGIFRNLPEGNFVIQVRFSDLTLLPPKNGRTSFYIFFFNSNDANGEKSISNIENSFYFSNTNPDGLPFLMFEKTPVAYSIKSSNDILLTCEKQSQLVKCNMIGTETTSTLQEFTFDPSWNSILVGYYSDQNGYVKVNISHFQIVPKNSNH